MQGDAVADHHSMIMLVIGIGIGITIVFIALLEALEDR
jgi:hypothetical protein